MIRATFITGIAAIATAKGRHTNPFARLEARYGGRLGVFARDTATGARLEHRANERFPLCSTFKVLLVGAVLARVDSGREHLARPIVYHRSDLLSYAPVTTERLAHGAMTVRELCAAAVELSDNTAANLLLGTIGGPAAVTHFARAIGDTRTRLDRMEPTLNDAIPGDPRDTTTPAAMAATIQKLTTGTTLTRASQRALLAWMAACQTGFDCIRAGVPKRWHVADKTGGGNHATRNDIAIVTQPGRPPIFVAAYYTGSSANATARDTILADVGRIVSSTRTRKSPS